MEASFTPPSYRLWGFTLSLGVFDEFFLDRGSEPVFVLCDSLLDFRPSSRAVPVFHSDNLVNRFVDFPPVISRDLYPCSLEDLFQMSKIACQDSELKDIGWKAKAFEIFGLLSPDLDVHWELLKLEC